MKLRLKSGGNGTCRRGLRRWKIRACDPKFAGVPASRKAFALILTLFLLAAALAVFASLFAWVNSNAIITQRNNQYNTSQNAAESGVESVIGRMDRDFISSSISSASAYTGVPATIDQSGWPVQFTLSDTNGNANVAGVIFGPPASTTVPLDSQYAGLYGLAQNVDIYVTATPIGQRYRVPATVHESLQFADIPLFQFAIFYNINLEVDPGAAMNIVGPVFCNQNIWEGSSSCAFESSVTAVGTNAAQISNPFALNYNGSGAPTFTGGPPLNNANSLVMPIGTDNSPAAILALLNLPPTAYAMNTPAAYSSAGSAYPANGADLVITNFPTGTNFGSRTLFGTNLIVYYQDSSLQQVAYDYYLLTNRYTHTLSATNYVAPALATNIIYAGFSWVTNVIFYDWREGWNGGSGPAKAVQAVQIDIGLLNKWLTNAGAINSGYNSDQLKFLHTGGHIASVYIYNSVPLTSSQMPAVRLTDGAQLPAPGGSTRGFSVATSFPLYVQGDYNSQNGSGSALGSTNTTHTLPAAIMGDAITILSDSWNDSKTTQMPTPSSTTVNAAMLEGIVASNPQISGNYSGGVENFMRLLENWSGSTLTYNGSIVVLFYSQYATNSWLATGNYYNPPTRNWAFDSNFRQSSKLPPLTPSIRAMVRGNWQIQ